jgi:hypothetical protein
MPLDFKLYHPQQLIENLSQNQSNQQDTSYLIEEKNEDTFLYDQTTELKEQHDSDKKRHIFIGSDVDANSLSLYDDAISLNNSNSKLSGAEMSTCNRSFTQSSIKTIYNKKNPVITIKTVAQNHPENKHQQNFIHRSLLVKKKNIYKFISKVENSFVLKFCMNHLIDFKPS